MRFYTKPHQWYCGIDLHARTMYVCILSWDGEIGPYRNMKTTCPSRKPKQLKSSLYVLAQLTAERRIFPFSFTAEEQCYDPA